MSLERREELVEHIVEMQPELRAFVRHLSQGQDLIAGSWDLLSYSFQRGFEALWDQARVDHSGLLLRPLLFLWRQSVELALKASIVEIAERLDGRPGHDLNALFAQLLDALKKRGMSDDDELTNSVREMISLVQSVDPFADRFRYPRTKDGKAFEGIGANLDELFQAHWVIVTYCEGAALEVEEGRRVG